MSKTFYITTTLPYVNAEPHIGFATEIIRADIIARFKRTQGYDVFFNTGTDEHGIKLYRKALEAKLDPQAYVDGYAEKFKELIPLLHISDVHFIRTTDPQHKKNAQDFWNTCNEKGFIYKKKYQVKYCVGCELEKTDSELVNGKCPIHPAQEIELIDEENYFFKFSHFQKPLLDLYDKNPLLVIPDFRFNEIKAFVKRGLEDFSISRLKEKMPWGVPVPGDDDHVMYVWFDALVNYVFNKEKWHEAVQYCGKDNLRQQSAMWQAMLLAVGMEPSKHIVINGFITVGGQKMSKSTGNVVNPLELVSQYGAEALRYHVVREFNPFEDSDFTFEGFKTAYNANLANGIGNLASRVIQMVLANNIPIEIPKHEFDPAFVRSLENFNIKEAADFIWKKIGEADAYIQREEPFKKIKTDLAGATKDLKYLLSELTNIAHHLGPIMPETSKEIFTALELKRKPMLFPRK
ncbi:MAG: methionine--tRNA ligase [Candidatus Pacebacteria bacterium]|jgi:methionyl-tRNA synthetase|nr:methionine--tRNA ligase [Candidatus Paceibacterota bacterium]